MHYERELSRNLATDRQIGWTAESCYYIKIEAKTYVQKMKSEQSKRIKACTNKQQTITLSSFQSAAWICEVNILFFFVRPKHRTTDKWQRSMRIYQTVNLCTTQMYFIENRIRYLQVRLLIRALESERSKHLWHIAKIK